MTSTLTAAQEGLATVTWELDPVHSRVGFALDYLAGTFHGSFAPFEAALAVADDGTATLSGSAKVDSIQVQDENLGAHLASPEFFDAEQSPEISFASDGFQPAGSDLAVPGELTIKGITKPVRLTGTIGGPIVDPYGRQRLNVRVQTTVDRTHFGLDWNVPLPSGEPALGREVTLDAELALIKS
jgi:polyisoprenoid-binding protein YceI